MQAAPPADRKKQRCSAGLVFRSSVPEILMNELDRNGAFAHARSDALHGSASHIAGRKYAGHARFEQSRIAGERPTGGTLPIRHKVRPAQDETFIVTLDRFAQPPRFRLG